MSRFSAEKRFSLYYAVLFGSLGSMLPFAAVWMNHAGITPAMIGVIVAAPSVLMLFTTVRIGRWADSLSDRRSAIIAANWLILLVHLVLFVFANDWAVLLVWLVAGVCMYAKVPITDASALSLTRRHGSDFARVRMFGSIGFVLTLTLAGYVYEHLGIRVFVIGLLIANVLRLLAAYTLPESARSTQKGPEQGGGPSNDADQVHATAANQAQTGLFSLGILLTLFGGALINASHAMVNTYGILLWIEQGLSKSTAGQAVAIGVVVEIALMWWFRSLTRNVSARACLLVAACCGLLRWSLLATEPTLGVVFLAQALHGFTFGVTFLACASFISRRVAESSAARGQSLNATINTGCMAVATFSCGQLFTQLGSGLYWAMAALCLAAISSISASYFYGFSDKP